MARLSLRRGDAMTPASALPYSPMSNLVARLKRRSARLLAKRPLTPKLSQPIVSFTFDDCPISVRDNALPRLEEKGWRSTIYAALGLSDVINHLGPHMSAEDYKAAYDAGHEIGDHTYSHLDPMQAGPEKTWADIQQNLTALSAAGIAKPTTFAFPYGEVTPALKRALSPHFDLLRGIHSPASDSLDLSLAASQRLYSQDMDNVMTALEVAAVEKRWLILFTHDVRPNPSEFGCTPSEFEAVLDRVTTLGFDVLPVAEALERAR